MSDIFNPDAFLNMTLEGANDTKVVPCPVGEFPCVIDKVEFNTWQNKEGTKSGIKLDVTYIVDDENCRQITGRDKVQVRQSVMLDMLEDKSGLNMGKGMNVQLGRLREAAGLNNPGEPFSFGMLVGRIVKGTITHREYNGDLFAEVKAVAKFA